MSSAKILSLFYVDSISFYYLSSILISFVALNIELFVRFNVILLTFLITPLTGILIEWSQFALN